VKPWRRSQASSQMAKALEVTSIRRGIVIFAV
jgi:hypothetical protein